MKIEKWINNNYSQLIDNAKRITKDEVVAYDVLHTCLEALLTYSQSKKDKLVDDDMLENYITKCVSIQYYSKTSPYHRKNRKQRQNENLYEDWKHDIEDEDDTIYLQQCDCVEKEIDNLHWYQKTLIQKKFTERMTYQQLHKYYGISKNALLKDIQGALEELRKKCMLNK